MRLWDRPKERLALAVRTSRGNGRRVVSCVRLFFFPPLLVRRPVWRVCAHTVGTLFIPSGRLGPRRGVRRNGKSTRRRFRNSAVTFVSRPHAPRVTRKCTAGCVRRVHAPPPRTFSELAFSRSIRFFLPTSHGFFFSDSNSDSWRRTSACIVLHGKPFRRGRKAVE